MKYILILLTAAFLVGCQEANDPTPLANTKAWFDRPETVGTLPDGIIVKYIVRDMGSTASHYIYFVDGTTTTNIRIPQGKTSYQQIVVEIDGVKYLPLEETKQ